MNKNKVSLKVGIWWNKSFWELNFMGIKIWGDLKLKDGIEYIKN